MTWTTLHAACEHRNDAQILEQTKLSSFEAFELDNHGSTPLHIAMLCYPQISTEVLKELVCACPSSVGVKDNFGNTPAHIYLKNLPSLKGDDKIDSFTSTSHILNIFLDYYPQVCQIKDKDGFTILHLFCKNARLEENIIQRIISLNPHALTSKTKMGYRINENRLSEPKMDRNLHPVTDAEHRTMASISDLKYTDEMNYHSRDGTYPLHLALENPSLTLRIVKTIIDSDPSILSMTDKYKRSPLQVATAIHAPDHVIELLFL